MTGPVTVEERAAARPAQPVRADSDGHSHLPFLQASKPLTGYPLATPSGGAEGEGACEVVP